MGLTLHYAAQIRDKQQLKELTTEVADICESMKWEYSIVNTTMEVAAELVPRESGEGDPKTIHLQGITFIPPECETVSLLFTQSGRLTTFVSLMMAQEYADYGMERDIIYGASVKTQFAGAEVHLALVKLLKYLEQKYLKEVAVTDEGHYWETMDKEVLLQRFDVYDTMLEVVVGALENGNFDPNSTPRSLSDQIEQVLRDKMGSVEIKRIDRKKKGGDSDSTNKTP